MPRAKAPTVRGRPAAAPKAAGSGTAKSKLKKKAQPALKSKPAAKQTKRPAAAPKVADKGSGAAKSKLKKKAQPALKPKPAAKQTTRPAAASSAATGSEATKKTDWKKLGQVANTVRLTYHQGCEFPEWSAKDLATGKLDGYARTVRVYYREGDDDAQVKRMTEQREPANVGMMRCYDENAFEETFGYRNGAYAESTETALMPNIAIYCRTPMQSPFGEYVDVHVINVVGYAFDSEAQPDWNYFLPLESEKWAELVRCMQQMWRYVYECAKRLKLKRVYLADVGGGAFSTGLDMKETTSYKRLKEASLPPVQQEYAGLVDTHQLQRIPDWCFTEEAGPLLSESLLVNAWDPWSLVGNANAGDNSLDGFFGRCTAMGVLCWPKTNPHMEWEPVKEP